MPRITITDEQGDALENLRAALDQETGPYGHVRPQDTIQFLLDEYTAGRETEETEPSPQEGDDESGGTNARDTDRLKTAIEAELEPMSYQDLQHLAGETDGVEPKGRQTELRGRLAASIAASVRERLVDESPTDGTEYVDDNGNREDNASDGAPDGGGQGDESSSGGASSVSTGEDTSPGPLQRAMRLLDDHEDRWREVNDERAKYEVTLPDGRTEPARTKDDVRALLMKHY